MIDHVSLGTRGFEEAIQFYSESFAPLGYQLSHRTPEEAAFGPDGNRIFWLYPVPSGEAVVGARGHIAVSADTHEKILRFHEAALRRGATTVRAPGERPDISLNYFGTVIRDLDGHTIEVVQWSK
jgi:catechol 2,3-dioxygenase-like lactoylglutathione lyase family enzyme